MHDSLGHTQTPGQVRRLAAVRAPAGSARERRLRDSWEEAPGWRGWLSTVDHKRIGLRYIVTSFLFLIAGGIEALILRLQLAGPDAHWLSPEQYNQLFTMHGITMIFLYALPILSGFSNYLWPLVLGARDMAFPRLNALSYWLFLFAGILLYSSFPLGQAPNAGWFNYVPLAAAAYDPGPNIDVYALGMIALGISTTAGSINFVVTLLRMRAPGMSIDRVPILVWGTLTASAANLLAVPAVSLAFFMLWLDRRAGAHFFDVAAGGQPLLWQHLFWMFGHPWVYVVVLPAMGIVSDALPTFCRRPLVGYAAVAISTVATMAIGFVVWAHHMFATGMKPIALSFFGATSTVISVPSAVATFAWLATVWLGRPVFRVPMLFFLAFVFLFVVGGVSGVMTAAVPLDLQLTDTYFVVAHLHYVLLGINVFPVLGGIYYWFPKATGRMTSERRGRLVFWTTFAGLNLGFFPMHISGLLGMPRRIYTYSEDMGWDTSNLITTLGSFLFAAGILLFLIDLAISWRRGPAASNNPWDAASLEWSLPSPPPPYNFAVIPQVRSRHPLWESRIAPQTGSRIDEGPVLDQGRQALATSALHARPDAILDMPGESFAPLLLGLFCSLACAAVLLDAWATAWAMVAASGMAIVAWLWPRGPRRADAGPISNGWWGMVMMIVTEGSLFSYLIFSYFYLAAQASSHWPPEGMPRLGMAGLNTGLLLASSVFVWLGERFARSGRTKRAACALGASLVLGAAFVAIQLREWGDRSYGLDSHQYGSLYFTMTGFHLAHVAVGLCILVLLLLWTCLDHFGGKRTAALRVGGLYWHFVDAVWLFIFATLYLSPFVF